MENLQTFLSRIELASNCETLTHQRINQQVKSITSYYSSYTRTGKDMRKLDFCRMYRHEAVTETKLQQGFTLSIYTRITVRDQTCAHIRTLARRLVMSDSHRIPTAQTGSDKVTFPSVS